MRGRRLAAVAMLVALAALAAWWLVQGGPAETGAEPAAESSADAAPPDGDTAPEAPAPPPPEIQLTFAESDDSPSDEHGALEGRVLAATSSQSVSGAELVFVRDDAVHTTTSGRDGKFRFAAPAPGTYELGAVTAEGYLPFAPQFGHSPIRFVARPGLVVRDVTIFLEPALDYTAEVLGPDGAPVAGAAVQVLTEDPGDLVPQPPPVLTAADGTATFHAADDAVIEATHPGFTPARAELDFPAQMSHRLVLHLGQGGAPEVDQAIAGRVVGPDGEPVAGALVRAEAQEVDGLRGDAFGTADATGAFELGPLDPGIYRVVGELAPLGIGRVQHVKAGRRDVVVKLPAGAVLRGRVFALGKGDPVVSFALAMRSHDRSDSRTLSFFDPEGRFEIDGLGRGRYHITVVAAGFAPQKVLVVLEIGQPKEIDIGLAQGSRVVGRVFDERSHAPLAGARVSGEGDAGGTDTAVPLVARTITGADGRFSLIGLPTGLQSIVAVRDGYHGRIISGLQLGGDAAGDSGAEVGPIDIGLTALAPGETPSLELTGIGAVLSRDQGNLVINKLIDGGGAGEAGLRAGDALVQIGDRKVKDLDFGEAINLIRGAEGSSLTLTVRRDGKLLEVEVVRRRVRG